MLKLSIKTKIILATTLVLGLVFSGFSLVVYQKAKSAYVGRLDARLEAEAEKIREEVEEQYLEKRFPNESDLRGLKTEGLPDPLLRLSDSLGSVILADSLLNDWPKMSWSEVVAREFSFENRELAGHHYRSLWAPVEAHDLNQYSVQIAVSLKDVEVSLALLQLLLIIGVPVALLISAIAVYAIVSSAFRPLTTMMLAAERVSAENLSERLTPPKARDEVFKLTATFNTMMERIESAFKSQKQFVADASHEIRTPLSIIRSELDFSRNKSNDAPVRESLDLALDEVERLKRLSDDLLLLARLEASSTVLNIGNVRIDELLADCARRMKILCERKGVSILLRIDDTIEIQADEEKLRSAVLNLIDNAIKYSKEGGTVVVSTRGSGERIEIAICDEGEGISEGDTKYIFERFHRAESNRSNRDGSGLGLAIVRRIAQLHEGTVSVVSHPGKGSVFTLTLPRIASSPKR